MRTIKHIVLHCTATPQNATVEGIQKYWKNTLGWKSPGYHYIIKPDGTIVNLLPIDQVSNGVAGHNHDSINISYIGGVDAKGQPLDNRTMEQKASQIQLITDLKKKFPKADVLGHRDFPGVKKACPSFDVKQWLETAGIKT